MPRAGNTVLCPSRFGKRAGLMLNVLTTEKKKPGVGRRGGHRETLGGVGYVYDLDCGDGTMSICICPNSSNGIH